MVAGERPGRPRSRSKVEAVLHEGAQESRAGPAKTTRTGGAGRRTDRYNFCCPDKGTTGESRFRKAVDRRETTIARLPKGWRSFILRCSTRK